MYYQLNKEERYLIDKMFNIEQKSIRYIAKILNRSPSTIVVRYLVILIIMEYIIMNMLLRKAKKDHDIIIVCIC